MAPKHHADAALYRWLAQIESTKSAPGSVADAGSRAAAQGLFTDANADIVDDLRLSRREQGEIGVELDLAAARATSFVTWLLEQAPTLGAAMFWIDAAELGVGESPWRHRGVELAQGLLHDRVALSLAGVWDAGAIRRAVSSSLAGELRGNERFIVVGDPLATLARYGSLEVPVDEAVRDLATQTASTRATGSTAPTVAVSTLPYQLGGASPSEEIGLALATATHYLRALESAGLSVEQAASAMIFRFGVGPRLLQEVAKLRAARRAWTRLLAACGVDASRTTMLIHSVVSTRSFSTLDPWNNILRATVASTAAHIGSSDVVYHTPMDALSGIRHRFAQRLAINNDCVLRLEAGLDNVADPAAGSYAIETLTQRCLREAWSFFRELERTGRIVAALESGSLAERLASRSEQAAAEVKAGDRVLVGVNRYQRESWPDVPCFDGEDLTYPIKPILGRATPTADNSLAAVRPFRPAEAVEGDRTGESA